MSKEPRREREEKEMKSMSLEERNIMTRRVKYRERRS
jgi:hypothetical protein